MARPRLVPAVAAGAALVLGLTTLSAAPAEAGGGGHDRQHRWVQKTLRQMTLEQKVGQLFVPYVTGATADTASAVNLDRFGVATPAEAVQKLHLGGVIYFAWSDNTQDPEQIARLSGGAYCPFDASSAQQLKDLLSAVAVFAAGGRPALADYSRGKGEVVRQLSYQVGNR